MSPSSSFFLSTSFSMARASSYLRAVRATILIRIPPSWSSNSSVTAPETDPRMADVANGSASAATENPTTVRSVGSPEGTISGHATRIR